MTAEVPGIDEKDIEIKVEDNTLTLKGERKFEKETKEENYHRIERSYGSFYRAFTLPNSIDPDKIQAEHENGVLKITMPKRQELKPRKVKILKPVASEKPKSDGAEFSYAWATVTARTSPAPALQRRSRTRPAWRPSYRHRRREERPAADASSGFTTS